MTDDQQRARELLAQEYERDGITHVPDCIRREAMLTEMEHRAIRAITAALRAAPEEEEDEEEEDNDAIERAAKALHANGADSMTSDTPWSELHDGEVNQFRSWARAALVAARPQGVSDG